MAKKKLTAAETRQKFYENFYKAKEVLKNRRKFIKKYSDDPIFMTVGLDLGMGKTGFATCNYKTGMMAPYLIKPKGKTRYLRLHDIVQNINGKMKLIPPLLIGIENYNFGFRQGASIITSIAELGGVARYGLGNLRSRILQISPMQLKKWVLGVGRGDKNLILLGVYKRYGIECKTDDEADAIVLADIARCFSLWVLKGKLESSDDDYLREYLKNPPKLFKRKDIKIRKAQWEILVTLVTEQGDKLDQFDI